MDIQKIFEQLYVKNAPSWSIERDPDNSYKYHATQSAFLLFKQQQYEIEALKAELNKTKTALPEQTNCKGGYYLQDCRGYIGNCMKFWYTHGYGAKLLEFHLFSTKEEALSAAGGAPWHKPWYAPYINSLAEYTIDMQLADRNAEKAMIESQEQIPKEETPNGC